MTGTYTIEVVPFSEYDWTFEKPGWINLNPAAVGLIAAFCGIAFWMALELLVLVYVTFRQRRGLYFYSIIVTTIGVILQTTGYLLKAFENSCPPVLVTIICKLGWVSNVTGFSLVLWSRLHLVVRSPATLRGVLCMIGFNAVVLHTPIVVFEFALLSRSPAVRDRFLYPMEVMERIQQTVFTLQEVVISGLYIFHTARFLHDDDEDRVFASPRTKKVVALLIVVQVIAISFDAGLTAFDYLNMFTLKCTLHPFVYSVKLKLEFIVLNQLLTIVRKGLAPGLGDGNFPDLNNSTTRGEQGAAAEVQFVTQALPGAVSAGGVNGKEGRASLSSSVNNGAAAVGDQSAEFRNDEQSLVDVVGRPDSAGIFDSSSSEDNIKGVAGLGVKTEHGVDDSGRYYVPDDVERQYLGRFKF